MNSLIQSSKVAIASIVLAGCIAHAQVTPQSGGYLIRQKYTKGSTLKYGMTVNTKGAGAQPGANMSMNIPIALKVLGVSGDVADIEVTAGPMTMNGRPMNSSAASTQKQRMKINSRGEAVGGAAQNASLTGSLPKGPVKVGQTWRATVPIAGQMGMAGGQPTATYRFVGLKNRNGRQVAEIAVSMAGAMKGNGTMILAASDGQIITSNFTMSMTMNRPAAGAGGGAAKSQPQTMTMQFAMVRK
jgi:hypothetical protein